MGRAKKGCGRGKEGVWAGRRRGVGGATEGGAARRMRSSAGGVAAVGAPRSYIPLYGQLCSCLY